MVPGANRESRWLTTSRTLSGVPSSASGRVSRIVPSTTSKPPVSASARQNSQTRKAFPSVSSLIALASSGTPELEPGPGGMANELGHVLVGEAGQAEPNHVLGSAQVGERLRERLRHVGLGVAERREQEQAAASRRPARGAA